MPMAGKRQSVWKLQMSEATDYRELVERAGGIFVGVRDYSVLFPSDSEGRRLSLYLFACRTVSDVELALKFEREQDREFSVWEKGG